MVGTEVEHMSESLLAPWAAEVRDPFTGSAPYSPRVEQVKAGLQSKPVLPKAGKFAGLDPVVARRVGGYACCRSALVPGEHPLLLVSLVESGSELTGHQPPLCPSSGLPATGDGIPV